MNASAPTITDEELVLDRLTWEEDDIVAIYDGGNVPRWIMDMMWSDAFEGARDSYILLRSFRSQDGVLFKPEVKS